MLTGKLVVARTDRKDPKHSFYHGEKGGRTRWGGPKGMFYFSSLRTAQKFAARSEDFSIFIVEKS